MKSARDDLPPGIAVFERGWLSSNNILLVGPDDAALVDSGYCTHATQTVALVEAALDGRPLDLLLNTHLHSDHCGGNAALQQRFSGMETRIPPGEAAAVARWDESELSFRATGQQCPRFGFQGLVQPGGEERWGNMAWQVLSAPGHDPHSVILFEQKSRTLISADALWEKGFGVVFPELIGEPSFDDVAATFDLIESLHPAIVVPGHGPVFGDVGSALCVARDRLERQAADPVKHARHAMKVLMKFKLLELQNISMADWHQWLRQASYFEQIRARFFAQVGFEELAGELLEELVRSGAAARHGDKIVNC